VTEFKHEERVSRQQAAERLADIAYALTAGGTLELRTNGQQVRVPVANEVLVKRETRSNGDRVDVEVTLTWSAITQSALTS
jgi:amphi-Trp domain-containing protein